MAAPLKMEAGLLLEDNEMASNPITPKGDKY